MGDKRSSRAREFLELLQIIFVALLVSGCRLPQAHPTDTGTGKIAVRNNAASLLYDLLGDEQHVSKLLIIKRDRQELHQVIKRISSSADSKRKALEQLAKQDSTLVLTNIALPPGEKAARDAESETRRNELLRASGADFEFKLLLTQAEALAYLTHLAKVAAQNEMQTDRAKIFADISAELQQLHGEVVALLRSGSAGSKRL